MTNYAEDHNNSRHNPPEPEGPWVRTISPAFTARPKRVKHLENPPRSGRTACTGDFFEEIPTVITDGIPIVLCTGCARVARRPGF